MNLNFRTIGKFAFLLVFIGFLMPMACDMNGFQLIDSGLLADIGIVAMIIIFVTSILGFIIGIILLAKKPIPIAIDWAVIIFCFGWVLGAFIWEANAGHLDYLQSGAYMIMVGSVLTILFQIISAIKKE